MNHNTIQKSIPQPKASAWTGRTWIFALLLCSLFAKAGHEVSTARISGSQVVTGGFVVGSDNKYPNVELSGTAKVARSTAKITFGVDETSLNINYFTSPSYNITVGLNLTSYDKNGAVQTISSSPVELTISYDPASNYIDKNIYIIEGSHRVVASIAYFKDANTGSIITNIPLNLFLETEITTQRYYTFDNTFTSFGGPASYMVSNHAVAASNELEISWQAIPGAEFYELEWTFVNDYTSTSGVYASTTGLTFSFRDNATRIQTTELKYRISLIYEHGYILYRIRGVGKNFADLKQNINGDWSADPQNSTSIPLGGSGGFLTNSTYNNSGINKSHFYYSSSADYEKNKNWQYASTFAEEGKKKEVLSYFDGSLRNRQSVTKNNSDCVAIIGETFYDYQGRPAVNALPAPSKNNSPLIKYYENFNLSDNNILSGVHQPFSRVDFDQDATGGFCPPSATGMYTQDTTVDHLANGASLYYSPNNPDKDQMQAYLPDALKFPFTHNVYTPDNTGRIRSQSGVGPLHQVNSGHETKYLYAQPDQSEIDRLFGSEVGLYYRYKKNIVVDANDQISVTYLNSEGKTIATALAGNPPVNLDSLDSYVKKIINQVYLDYHRPDYNQVNILYDNALTFTKPIVPTSDGPYNFYYNLLVPQFTDNCISPNYCYDCDYDLEISIKDDCGSTLYHSGPTNVGGISGFDSSVVVDGVCGTQINFSSPGTFSLSLQAAHTYFLEKTLTINQTAANWYADHYTDTTHNSCIKKLSQFEQDALAHVDTSGCDMTCAKCTAELNAYYALHNDASKADPSNAAYDSSYIYLSPAQYSQMLADCNAACKPVSLCETQYQLMLMDMSPNGQYAQYNNNTSTTGGYDAGPFPLSVLNYSNKLPVSVIHPNVGNWKNPVFYNLKLHGFVDAANNTAYINHYYEQDNITLSTVPVSAVPGQTGVSAWMPQVGNPAINLSNDPNNTSGDVFQDSAGNYFTYPERLSNLQDFVESFSPYWAHSLVKYHPEWGYFGLCDKNENPTLYTYSGLTSQDFDDSLRANASMASAVLGSTPWAGATSGTDIHDLLNHDPYFSQGGTGTTTQGQGFTLHTLMEGKLTNYNGSGRTLKEIASFMARCGTQYYNCTCTGSFNNSSFPASANTPAKKLLLLNTEWLNYKEMYLALKAKVQADYYNSVAENIAGIPGSAVQTGFFNAAIGNTSYNPYIYPNYANAWPWVSGYGYIDLAQPSSFATFFYYGHKQQRFVNDETLYNKFGSTPAEIQANAALTLYQETGQCPLAIKVQSLLDKLAKDHNLASSGNTDLFFYGQFTQDIYDQVVGTPPVSCANGNTGNSYIDYFWSPSVTGNVLTASLLENNAGSGDCPIHITDPSNTISSQAAWQRVDGFGNIKYQGQTSTPGIYEFLVDAFYDDDSNPATVDKVVNVVITSCIKSTCGSGLVTELCQANATGLEMLNIINALNGQSNGASPAVHVLDAAPAGFNILDASNATSGFVTNHFASLFGLTLPGSSPNIHYTSSYTAGSITSSFSYGGTTLSMGFAYTSTLTGLPDISTVSYFTSLVPDQGSSNIFYLTAHFPDGSTQQVKVTVSCSGCVAPFQTGDCAPPIPAACNTPGYNTMMDLQNFMNEMAQKNDLPPPSNSYANVVDVSGFNHYTALLQNDGFQNNPIAVVSHSANNKTLILRMGGDLGCLLTLKSAGTNTVNFSTILSFSNIYAVDGSPGTFTVQATIPGGTVTLNGQSACLVFENCEVCNSQDTLYVETFESYNSTSTAASMNFASNYPYNGYVSCPDLRSGSYPNVFVIDNCTGNHTNGGGTGNVLLVVGPVTPAADTLWKTKHAITVQPGMTYNFSAWTRLIYDYRDSIELVIVDNNHNVYIPSTYKDGSFGSTWQHLFGTWGSGTATSVNLYIVDVKSFDWVSHAGQYIDDITFTRKMCPPVSPPPPPPPPPEPPCKQQMMNLALHNAQDAYNAYIDSVRKDFLNRYTTLCSHSLETFTVNYYNSEHHFTLYYYDQAGNLIKTIPPEGVEMIDLMATVPNSTQNYSMAIQQDRDHHTQTVFTNHRMATRYVYNSLNQLVTQDLPDHDDMGIWSLNAAASAPSGINIQGMAFGAGMNGYLAGSDASGNGVIDYTTDEGQHWNAVTSVGEKNLEDIQFTSSTTGYAVTDDGYLLKTTDGGAHWNTENLPVTQFFTSMNMLSTGTGFITGKNGTLLKTTDGINWTPNTSLSAYSAVDFNEIKFAPDNLTGMIVGSSGSMLYTTDGGSSWHAASGPGVSSGGLSSLITLRDAVVYNYNAVKDSIKAVVVGDDGTGPKLINAGGSNISGVSGATAWAWPVSTLPSGSANLKTIVSTHNSGVETLLAGGSSGTLIKNTPSVSTTWSNAGATWLSGTTNKNIARITPASNGSDAYGALDNGHLLAYSASSSAWSEISSGSATPMHGVCVSGTDVYICGDAGTIVKDAGSTFTFPNTVVFPPLNNVAISHDASPYAYAVGNAGAVIYSTSASGMGTWNYLPSSISVNINAAYFTTQMNGVLVGSGGLTALVAAASGTPAVSSVNAVSGVTSFMDITKAPGTGGNYFACGSNGSSGAMAYSSNGTSWTAPSATFAKPLNSIFFFDAYNAFVVGNNGYFAKSTDGGLHWTAHATAVTVDLHKVNFADHLTGYAFGDNNTIIKTTDGGLNWIPEPGTAGNTGVSYHTAVFTSNGQAVIGGSAGANNVATLNDQSNDHSSRFFYDNLGRLIISQNVKQYSYAPVKAYSYTVYDVLGRITEVGEITNSIDPETIKENNKSDVILYTDPANPGSTSTYLYWLSQGTRSQVTTTIYDLPVSTAPSSFTQLNLRNRVSATYVDDADNDLSNGFTHGTYYTYDVHGNVTSLINDNPAMVVDVSRQYTRVDYEYDLVSGKVNRVAFQQGQPDAFYHKYEYDADNRITNVYSSRDGMVWDQDSKYFYYLHGPLARTETGDQKVQGLDYAYTLQGWLKGVNSTLLSNSNDIGKDANAGGLYSSITAGVNQYVAKDAYGYSLDYYAGDYNAIDASKYSSSTRFDAVATANTEVSGANRQLYNGNIMAMMSSLTNIDPTSTVTIGAAIPQLTTYRYDQLNRIKQMHAYQDITSNAWGNGSGSPANLYSNSFTYDANGNILTQKRSDQQGTAFDNLSYQYQADANGKKVNNRLYHVNDAASAALMGDDIDDEGTFTQAQPNNPGIINTANNYGYSPIGELTRDNAEEIADIEWNVYGKISSITRIAGSTKPDLYFEYDAAGNRISKTVHPKAPRVMSTTTYYLRDAQGNVLATYVKGPNFSDGVTLKNTEYDIYGSHRSGLLQEDSSIVGLASRPLPTDYIDNGNITPTTNSLTLTYVLTHTRGYRMYEMTNHLGNVLSVVNDKKTAFDGNSDGVIDNYRPNVTSETDYAAFGAPLPGRNYNSPDYRYGFNGKEKDDELIGNGDSYDYGMRMYDPRLGRPLSIDPLTSQYPQLSPYQFFSNSPIMNVDVDGMEAGTPDFYQYMWGTTGLTEQSGKDISRQTLEVIATTAKYAGPPILIIGGIASVVATAGGTAGPLLAAFTTISGTYAVAAGTAQLTLNSLGHDNAAQSIPTAYLDATIGLTIQGTVGDQKFTTVARGVINLTEGLVTLDLKNIKFPVNGVETVDKTINISSVVISTFDVVDKASQQTNTTNSSSNKPKYVPNVKIEVSVEKPDVLNLKKALPNSKAPTGTKTETTKKTGK